MTFVIRFIIWPQDFAHLDLFEPSEYPRMGTQISHPMEKEKIIFPATWKLAILVGYSNQMVFVSSFVVMICHSGSLQPSMNHRLMFCWVCDEYPLLNLNITKEVVKKTHHLLPLELVFKNSPKGYVYIHTWYPKQPFLNGCLVKQPFPK